MTEFKSGALSRRSGTKADDRRLYPLQKTNQESRKKIHFHRWTYQVSLQRKKCCRQIIGLDDESFSVAVRIDTIKKSVCRRLGLYGKTFW